MNQIRLLAKLEHTPLVFRVGASASEGIPFVSTGALPGQLGTWISTNPDPHRSKKLPVPGVRSAPTPLWLRYPLYFSGEGPASSLRWSLTQDHSAFSSSRALSLDQGGLFLLTQNQPTSMHSVFLKPSPLPESLIENQPCARVVSLADFPKLWSQVQAQPASQGRACALRTPSACAPGEE